MSGDAITLDAPAKVNLALVVGPTRPDGKHEVVTVLQAVELADRVTVARSRAVAVEGFSGDTLVTRALEAVRERTGACFAATIAKRIPVAAGLGGGSSDAATALRAANGLLDEPLPDDDLHALAAGLGADVPFFLRGGSAVGTGDGSQLAPVTLPLDYVLLLVLPRDAVKESTAAVYGAFDARGGEAGFDARAAALRAALERVDRPAPLAALPANDLAASPLAADLRAAGALRADVTGAGPVVYGVFADEAAAVEAARRVAAAATWVTRPVGPVARPS